MEEKILKVLDRVRPYLINDGGDIEFVDFKDGVCYLKFLGHCANCSLMMMTLDDGIKDALINEIPEIIDVKLVNNDDEDINFFDLDMEDDDYF